MKCTEIRTSIIKSIESGGSLTAAVQEHIDRCRACRTFYQALYLTQDRTGLLPDIPEGLEDRIMLRIEESQKGERTAPQPPSRRMFTPMAGFAAAALLLVVLSVSLTLVISSLTRPDTMVVHLYLSAPQAQRVAVVGDWNNWDGGADLLSDTDGDGVWEISIEVPRDQEYQYQFLIDEDQWLADPNAPIKVEDGFGGTNSVLDI